MSNSIVDRLLEISKDKTLKPIWEEFLAESFSLENWHFWLETNQYKETIEEEDRLAKAHVIYDRFLTEGVAEEVNVDNPKRIEILKSISSGDVLLFDDANWDVAQYLEYDVARKFFLSTIFKENKEKIEESRRQERRTFLSETLANKRERELFRNYTHYINEVDPFELWETIGNFEIMGISDPERLKPHVESIFETYFSEGAQKPVSVSAFLTIPLREKLVSNSISPSMFSAVKEHLFNSIADTLVSGFKEMKDKEMGLLRMNVPRIISFMNERQGVKATVRPIKEILLELKKEFGIQDSKLKGDYLLVKKDSDETWTKQWVRLKSGGLFFYESEQSAEEKSFHKFESNTQIEQCLQEFVSFSFKVHTGSLSTFLATKTAKEMQTWRNAINSLLKLNTYHLEEKVPDLPEYPTSISHIPQSTKSIIIEIIQKEYSIFGLFRGHFGPRCSQFVAKKFPGCFLKRKDLFHHPLKALRDTCIKVDEMFLEEACAHNWQDGATGIIAYIRGSQVYLAIMAETHGLYCANGTRRLTFLGETKIPPFPRVFGNLALKGRKKVTNVPYLATIELALRPEFLILGTGAFWEKVDIYTIIQYFRSNMAKSSLKEIRLSDLSKKVGLNNKQVSALIIQLGPILSREKRNQLQFEDIFDNQDLFLSFRDYLSANKLKENLCFFLDAMYYSKKELESNLPKYAQQINKRYFLDPVNPTIALTYDLCLPIIQAIQKATRAGYCTRSLFESSLQTVTAFLKGERWINFLKSDTYGFFLDKCDINLEVEKGMYSLVSLEYDVQLYQQLYSLSTPKLAFTEPQLPEIDLLMDETKDYENSEEEIEVPLFKLYKHPTKDQFYSSGSTWLESMGGPIKSTVGNKQPLLKPRNKIGTGISEVTEQKRNKAIAIGDKERRTSRKINTKSVFVKAKQSRSGYESPGLDDLLTAIESTLIQIRTDWERENRDNM